MWDHPLSHYPTHISTCGTKQILALTHQEGLVLQDGVPVTEPGLGHIQVSLEHEGVQLGLEAGLTLVALGQEVVPGLVQLLHLSLNLKNKKNKTFYQLMVRSHLHVN